MFKMDVYNILKKMPELWLSQLKGLLTTWFEVKDINSYTTRRQTEYSMYLDNFITAINSILTVDKETLIFLLNKLIKLKKEEDYLAIARFISEDKYPFYIRSNITSHADVMKYFLEMQDKYDEYIAKAEEFKEIELEILNMIYDSELKSLSEWQNEQEIKELYLILICILNPRSAIYYEIDIPEVSESSYIPSSDDTEENWMDISPVGSDASIKYQKVKKIRGDIKTYAKEMMGYFIISYTVDESALIVDIRSEISRPSFVTGSLGQKKGDHLIAISYYIKMLESEFRNKTVKEVICRLIVILGGDYYADKLNKEINLLITKGKELASQYDSKFKEGNYGIKVSEYIKQELIPIVVAIWNQRQGIAFVGAKTNVELGQEGGAVSAALKKLLKTKQLSKPLQKEDLNLAADIYVNSLVDFAVVKEDKSVSIDYLKMLSEGKRNNHISQVVLACGHIIKNFLEFFNVEESSQTELSKLVIIKFLQKEGKLGSWFAYYKSNPKMLGDGMMITIEEVSIEEVSSFLISKVRKEFILLIENELEMKSGGYEIVR